MIKMKGKDNAMKLCEKCRGHVITATFCENCGWSPNDPQHPYIIKLQKELKNVKNELQRVKDENKELKEQLRQANEAYYFEK
jgi:hypothetical protein